MASLQFVLLLVLERVTIRPGLTLLLIAITGLTYTAIGRRVFSISDEVVYRQLMTAKMLIFGLWLVL